MKKKIAALVLVLICILPIFCSCEREREKTYTSISTTFQIENVREAKNVIISAKEKTTGERIKIKLKADGEKTIELEPGTYIITDVSTGSKQIIISLNEQYFTVNKSHKNISFSVKEENVKNGLEWFLYNNSLYLLCLVGCSVILGISKYKKEKKDKIK